MRPKAERPTELTPVAPSDWTADRAMARRGFGDLKYLPKGRCAWNMTLTALAYASRRLVREHIERRPALGAGLNAWALRHGAPASGRYAELGDDAVVLWHGTSAVRAEKIREHGLVRNRGVWATTNPALAHGFARSRATAFAAGSAMVVLVLDRNAWEGQASLDTPTIARFYVDIAPEHIEYILWDDRIEFRGTVRARAPHAWGVARFRRKDGQWAPCSKTPVRFDATDTYSNFATWLDLSVRRLGESLGVFTAIEVFSSLYASLDPWDALTHDDVFEAIERLCRRKRELPGRIRGLELRRE